MAETKEQRAIRYREWATKNKEHLKKYYSDRQKKRTAHEPTRIAYNKYRRELHASRKNDAAYMAKKRKHTANYRKRYPERQQLNQLKSLLKTNYGLSIDAYHAMVEAQNNLCAICGRPPFRNRLDVDHCHNSGKVRALLCNNCNVRLEVLENLEWRVKGEAYLEKHRAQNP